MKDQSLKTTTSKGHLASVKKHPPFFMKSNGPVFQMEREEPFFRPKKKGWPFSSKSTQLQTKEEEPIQPKSNDTGLPDNLKTGIEHLSGYAMDDVKVHFNSSKPTQLNAHAFAQGTDIHLAAGQEKHLPHEAWHVVQQKQGRVQPTMQLKGTVNINDDVRLEKEADVMSAKALQRQHFDTLQNGKVKQTVPVVQRHVPGFKEYKSVDNIPEDWVELYIVDLSHSTTHLYQDDIIEFFGKLPEGVTLNHSGNHFNVTISKEGSSITIKTMADGNCAAYAAHAILNRDRIEADSDNYVTDDEGFVAAFRSAVKDRLKADHAEIRQRILFQLRNSDSLPETGFGPHLSAALTPIAERAQQALMPTAAAASASSSATGGSSAASGSSGPGQNIGEDDDIVSKVLKVPRFQEEFDDQPDILNKLRLLTKGGSKTMNELFVNPNNWGVLHRLKGGSFNKMAGAMYPNLKEQQVKDKFEKTRSKYNPADFGSDTSHNWSSNVEWLRYINETFPKVALTDLPLNGRNMMRQSDDRYGKRIIAFSAYAREIAFLLMEGYVSPMTSVPMGNKKMPMHYLYKGLPLSPHLEKHSTILNAVYKNQMELASVHDALIAFNDLGIPVDMSALEVAKKAAAEKSSGEDEAIQKVRAYVAEHPPSKPNDPSQWPKDYMAKMLRDVLDKSVTNAVIKEWRQKLIAAFKM